MTATRRPVPAPAVAGVEGPSTPAVERGAGRLRDGLAAACPPLTGRLPALRESVAEGYRDREDGLDAFVAAVRAGGPGPAGRPPRLGLPAALRAPVETAVLEGTVTAAAHEADALEAHVEAQLAADADVSVGVDPDGFAARYARRTVDRLLQAVEAAAAGYLRRAVRDDDAPRPADALAALADAHARLLAPAALLVAARCGSQALASACGAVVAKRWVVPETATCPLHGSLDGHAAPVERCFPVPAELGAAASAFVVGEHRPFACPCVQRAVPGPLPAEEPRAVAAREAVTVRVDGDPVDPLSDREREIYREHARPGETFADLLARVHETRSVRGGARELGVAKKTLYRWFDKYLDGFDRYSGR